MKISYEDLLYLFEQTENVDETRFYFCDDDENDEHYLGYCPEVGKVKPYWRILRYRWWLQFRDSRRTFRGKSFWRQVNQRALGARRRFSNRRNVHKRFYEIFWRRKNFK